MGEKLTPAQAAFLKDIARRPQRCVSSYKPAHKLVALGLATIRDYDPPYSLEVSITPAGRSALPEEER